VRPSSPRSPRAPPAIGSRSAHNLGSFHENDAWDLFAAYFPDKHVSITAAYADLGRIAMMPGLHGWYLSLQGSF